LLCGRLGRSEKVLTTTDNRLVSTCYEQAVLVLLEQLVASRLRNKVITIHCFVLDKFLNSSIMSETDMDSDEETLFENQKPYKPGRTSQMNGMLNGAKKKNHHT
jgi:hypothetical protein